MRNLMGKFQTYFFVAILALTLIPANSGSEEKLRVAVMDLANKTEISNDEALSLSKQIRMVASATLPKNKFLIMTKDNIKSLLPPDKKLSDCSTAKCVIELGRMISADYIITGSIIHFAGEMRIDFGAHHSLSADSLGGRTADAADLKGLEAQLKAKSTEVMGLIMSHAGVAAPARTGGGAVFVSPTQPTAPGGAAEVRALAPTEQPPATATGPAGLYITSEPVGAEVYLGALKAGTTSPAFQKVNLQAGTHIRVTLKIHMYHDVVFDVDLKPGVMKFEGVELKPAFGSLTIESEPSGAKVLIGGTQVGTTPFSKSRYPSGDYLVSVEKHWFLPASDQMISVRDGKTTRKMFTLLQDFGTLDVKSNPSGATVTLDGKKLGVTPDSWRVPPVKDGKVEIAKAAHRSKSFSITIDRNQTVKITAAQATLTAKLGSLQVYIDPPEPGAKVFVDGKEIGTAPATVSNLLEGTHEVKVKTQEKEGTATVSIVEGQTAVSQMTLAASFGLAAGGTVWKDSSSGLTWQVSPMGKAMIWNAAKSHCASLRLGGSSGWRLPTISELRSLIRGCPRIQKGGSCRVTDSCLSRRCWRKDKCYSSSRKDVLGPGGAYWPPELKGKAWHYWSSSAVVADSDYRAWTVGFDDGRVYYRNVRYGSFVRCVR
jgi:Protein of unknown function (DUF1566)/PEGA domain